MSDSSHERHVELTQAGCTWQLVGAYITSPLAVPLSILAHV